MCIQGYSWLCYFPKNVFSLIVTSLFLSSTHPSQRLTLTLNTWHLPLYNCFSCIINLPCLLRVKALESWKNFDYVFAQHLAQKKHIFPCYYNTIIINENRSIPWCKPSSLFLNQKNELNCDLESKNFLPITTSLVPVLF